MKLSRDLQLRHLSVREALELADDLADRIEATDPAGAALLHPAPDRLQ